MGLAEDLLQQANHLGTYEGINPTQAALRRAVSTAYYALFHLLIEEASQHWNGSPAASTALERAFNHGPMKYISTQFNRPLWLDWHSVPQTVPAALQRVARSFVFLQEERHTADYDNHEQWTTTDVQSIVIRAGAAFRDWYSVRKEPIAGDYLLAMLIGKAR